MHSHPGQCSSVGVSSRIPEGGGFDSRSGCVQEAAGRCLSRQSLFLFLSPPSKKLSMYSCILLTTAFVESHYFGGVFVFIDLYFLFF